MTDYKDIKYRSLVAGDIPNLATSKTTSGTFADARISSGSVTQHVTAFDDTDLRSDIMTLALKEAITENRVAYNLPNAMIEQFQDDSKIGTETTGDRNASEYWTTRGTVTTYGTRTQRTVAEVGTSVHHDTAQAKWGTSSIHIPNPSSSGYLTADGDSGTTGSFDFGTTNWTFEFWYRQGDWRGSWRSLFEFQDTGFAGTPTPANRLDLINNTTENQYWLIANSTGTDNRGSAYEGDGTEFIDHPDDTWRHFAVVRESTAITLYYNGSREWPADIGSGDFLDRRYFTLGTSAQGGSADGWFDDIRLTMGASSNGALYSGATYTIPTARLVNNDTYTKLLIQSIDEDDDANTFTDSRWQGTGTADYGNATGTLISTAQTANAAQTKVSGVILYKNNTGTATLGTDLKIYFTCDGGSNWTESTPTAAGTFSTGILMAKCPEVTCTSGTDIRYKAVWANQSSGSKETQLHGIGMNY